MSEKRVVISAPKFETVHIKLRGLSPLVSLRFSKKAELIAKHEAGSTSRSKRVQKARQFEKEFQDAQHISKQGWVGVPASAFRSAAIDVCRMTGVKMNYAKMSIFVEADGFDADEGTPLVRIIEGTPKSIISHVRNATGVVDLRCRAMWEEWSVVIRVTYDADQFTANDVINLISRAGEQVGLGEGRPYSKSSNGLGYGTFKVITQ
jgi:hypothetical protein